METSYTREKKVPAGKGLKPDRGCGLKLRENCASWHRCFGTTYTNARKGEVRGTRKEGSWVEMEQRPKDTGGVHTDLKWVHLLYPGWKNCEMSRNRSVHQCVLGKPLRDRMVRPPRNSLAEASEREQSQKTAAIVRSDTATAKRSGDPSNSGQEPGTIGESTN